ncbi:MAG: hypothetical protein WAT43_16420 [Chitinophagales bacterium]
MKNNPTELVDDLRVIRTIHSNKARMFGVYNFYYLIITVVVAVIVTFIGFSGPQSIANLFKTKQVVSDKNCSIREAHPNTTLEITDSSIFIGAEPLRVNNLLIEDTIGRSHYSEVEQIGGRHTRITDTTDNNSAKFVMDLMTLSILVISILGLILRFEQKANKHNNAVVRLTEFITQVEFAYLGGTNNSPTSFNQVDIGLYAEKYKSIINSLPPTKDSDYIYALKTIKRKKNIKAFIESVDYDKKNYFTRKWYILWI